MARGPKLYKSYLFKDKDPVIDVLRTVIKDKSATFKQIALNSGVSAGTLSKWFYGETRRPQFASTNAVARALGYEFALRPRVDLTLVSKRRG